MPIARWFRSPGLIIQKMPIEGRHFRRISRFIPHRSFYRIVFDHYGGDHIEHLIGFQKRRRSTGLVNFPRHGGIIMMYSIAFGGHFLRPLNNVEWFIGEIFVIGKEF